MKPFLYKEIKLNLKAVNYLFLAFPAMLIIPNYPVYVPFYYTCLSIFFIFNNANLFKDIEYSMILPIAKKEIVKSRCILVCTYELVTLLLSIPFALLMWFKIKLPNLAGIDINMAAYGLILICLTGFNYFFFTSAYKKLERPGRAFIKGSIAYAILYLIFDGLIWTEDITNLSFLQLTDKTDFHSQILQLPVLFAGIIIFILGWIITCKKAGKIFERVDL